MEGQLLLNPDVQVYSCTSPPLLFSLHSVASCHSLTQAFRHDLQRKIFMEEYLPITTDSFAVLLPQQSQSTHSEVELLWS